MTEQDEAPVAAFREYFEAFMHGSDEALGQCVGLPYFDLRAGELLEIRSPAQMDGFRRGLRARMASLGHAFGKLTRLRVLASETSFALLEFDSTRNSADGSITGGARSLAHLRCEAGRWRVWMITVMTTTSGTDAARATSAS